MHRDGAPTRQGVALLLLRVTQDAAHPRVPIVLDRVVRAAGELCSNLGPLGAHLLHQLHELLVLRICPPLLVDRGAHVIMPPARTRPTERK